MADPDAAAFFGAAAGPEGFLGIAHCVFVLLVEDEEIKSRKG
jgi:hypothetical protein